MKLKINLGKAIISVNIKDSKDFGLFPLYMCDGSRILKAIDKTLIWKKKLA